MNYVQKFVHFQKPDGEAIMSGYSCSCGFETQKFASIPFELPRQRAVIAAMRQHVEAHRNAFAAETDAPLTRADFPYLDHASNGTSSWA